MSRFRRASDSVLYDVEGEKVQADKCTTSKCGAARQGYDMHEKALVLFVGIM